MSTPQPLSKLTFEEYLAREQAADLRHEYVAGELYAMAGGSKNHNRIVLNLASSLLAKHEDGPCRVYAENVLLRFQVGDSQVGYYPDVMLVCDAKDSAEQPWSENPCLLIEVLSDSTQGIDRFRKFRDYKRLDSLQTYLLVSQQAAHVEVFHRSNEWRPEILTRADDTIDINCMPGAPVSLSLADIYRGLDFTA